MSDDALMKAIMEAEERHSMKIVAWLVRNHPQVAQELLAHLKRADSSSHEMVEVEKQ